MSERLDLDKHVGKCEVRIDTSALSPLIRGVVPAGTDGEVLMASLNAGLQVLLAGHLDDFELALGRPVFRLNSPPEIIKPKAERDAEREKLFDELSIVFQAGDAIRRDKMANHPDNGKYGFWEVTGVRHDRIVEASSAPEAIEKASQWVGDWESPEADYLGTELPENA